MDHPVADPDRLLHPVALWGVGGVVLLLAQAVTRLAPLAWEPVATGALDGLGWAAMAGMVGFFAYTEGFKGFHQRFSPRAIARATHLPDAPLWVQGLAPLACMGLIWASRRRQIASWALLTMIVVLVIGVRQLPSPWRGIVDAGVVVGLSVGILSLGVHWVRVRAGRGEPVDPCLPDPA